LALKKHVKNTGIPVFTGILMAVYRYSVFAISIHSTLIYFKNNQAGSIILKTDFHHAIKLQSIMLLLVGSLINTLSIGVNTSFGK
jgi:hypothetical protein